MVVFITYAISRYRLMDIRLIILRSIAFGFIVLIITTTFAVVSALIATLFQDLTGFGSNIIAGLIVGALVSISYQPMRRVIEKSTNRLLYKKRYDPDELISKINETASSILNLDQLLAEISGNLIDAFQCEKFGVALVENKNDKKLIVAFEDGFKSGVTKELVNFKGAVGILHQEVKREGAILVIDEMKTRYDNGEFEPVSPELLMALHQNDIALIVPLFTKEKLIGLLAIGTKKSSDPYNQQDLNVLGIVSGQIAIALENAQLYEEQKKFNIYLRQEVKKATRELAAANKELQRLDEAKSEFLSIASHQLRTPLTVIKGYISMMLEGSFGKVPKLIRENLDKVYLSSERLISLVESLLNISRIEAGRLEFDIQPVDLAEVVQPLVADFQNKAKEKKFKLTFQPEANLPRVAADPKKIKEVISNLLDNAVKYTEKGEIMVGLHQESQSVVFTCQDSGRGIEPEDLPRLFNKFVRGKGMMQVHTEGTGLGLYFARMVIENMGGRIWAESPGRNRGSKFSFSLPLADKKQATKIKS